MIIGVTGTKASGKGILTEILREKGFVYSSTSDRVREEAIARGITDYTIVDLQNIANKIREDFGTEELVRRTLKKLEGNEKMIIDGIRNPGEIEEIKKQGGIIFSIDAPKEQRFQRLIQRHRYSDPKTWEEFVRMEERDMGKGEESTGQQVAKCMEMADIKIVNDGTLETFKTRIEYALLKLEEKENPKKRPSWDEYFMGICEKVAERCTCDRGKGGTVIVKDKRILTTGYIGSPPGIPHCDEIGHLLKTVTHEDGNQTTHCMRTIHCELNALLQAAKLGIALDGSTLYTFKAPCRNCAMAIISAGIKRVVAKMRYHGDFDTADLFKQARVDFEVLSQEIVKYDKQ